MQPDKIKQWLTALEKKIYEGLMLVVDVSLADRELVDVFDSLAATRELLKKHEWACCSVNTKLPYCPEWVKDESKGHAPDCAWDAALKGIKGEK